MWFNYVYILLHLLGLICSYSMPETFNHLLLIVFIIIEQISLVNINVKLDF